jgi:GNAT superfamily N-acetyltransferase
LHPYEVFEGLDELIERTVHGTRIERFKPRQGVRPFHTFEIHTEGGETLGYLNMIYLKRPLPCYYLVYVEILPPFRGRGLGNKILKEFRAFAEDKGAMGLLDNNTPSEEPTYDIYTKLGWKGIEVLIGNGMVNGMGIYMVFISSSIKPADFKDGFKPIKLRERVSLDMQDNEAMVKRTEYGLCMLLWSNSSK